MLHGREETVVLWHISFIFCSPGVQETPSVLSSATWAERYIIPVSQPLLSLRKPETLSGSESVLTGI